MCMKKFISTLVFIFFIISIKAQMAGQSNMYGYYNEPVKKETNYKKNCFGLDFGIGKVSDLDPVVADLGFRYLHNFSEYWGWDVFNIKAFFAVDPDYFVDTLTPQLMSGFRFNTPQIGGFLSAFTAFKSGYGYWIEAETGGYCLEFEIGLNIGKTVFLAYAFNYQKGELDTQYSTYDIKHKYSAFRLGFNF